MGRGSGRTAGEKARSASLRRPRGREHAREVLVLAAVTPPHGQVSSIEVVHELREGRAESARERKERESSSRETTHLGHLVPQRQEPAEDDDAAEPLRVREPDEQAHDGALREAGEHDPASPPLALGPRPDLVVVLARRLAVAALALAHRTRSISSLAPPPSADEARALVHDGTVDAPGRVEHAVAVLVAVVLVGERVDVEPGRLVLVEEADVTLLAAGVEGGRRGDEVRR